MPRIKRDPLIPKAEAMNTRCSKHSGSYIMYDPKKWNKCPFCVCQEALNPRINEESPLKNSNLNRNQNYPKNFKVED